MAEISNLTPICASELSGALAHSQGSELIYDNAKALVIFLKLLSDSHRQLG